MTAYQFRLFDSNDPEYPLLGVVSADDTDVTTNWTELAPPELIEGMETNFALKLEQRPEIEGYASLPPTEILRYNLPFLTSAVEEFPDLATATTNAERLVQENQTGLDYEEALQ